MEKDKIVTELYSLRAGLSLLAQQSDNYESERIVAETRKTEELAQAQAVNDKKTQFSPAKYKVKEAWNAAYNRVLEAVGKVSFFAERRKEKKLTLTFGILFLVLYLAFAGLSYLNLYLLNFNGFVLLPVFAISLAIGITEIVWAFKYFNYEDSTLHWSNSTVGFVRFIIFIVNIFNAVSYLAFMIIGFCGAPTDTTAIITVIAISTGLCAVMTMIMIFKYYKQVSTQTDKNEFARLNAEYKRLREESEKLHEIYDKLCEDNEAADKKYEILCHTAKQEYKSECKKIEAKYKATCDASAKVYTTIFTSIWDTLVKTYGDLLDVRDWKILDLVIWQLETRRADTLKEALQLADREVQTDRIVGVLQSASETISSQIRIGFGSLQSQLDYNFNTLARGFATASYQIASRLDDSMQLMQANQIAVNRSLERICSQSSLQTALLEKAGTSSDKLVEAVNKLRKTKFKLEAN